VTALRVLRLLQRRDLCALCRARRYSGADGDASGRRDSTGARQRRLLGPLVEEERAVSITLAILQDRVPASFTEVAPRADRLRLANLAAAEIDERRRLEIEGSGLSEYLVTAIAEVTLDERSFLVPDLGANIFAVTLDRTVLKAGGGARLIVVAGAQQ
jgi:conjugal transfer pilus assembly protein TraK